MNYAINKIISQNLKTIGEVHGQLYRELIEWFGLPSRIAVDCYRDALANVRAWRRNPYRGKRPRVGRLSMLLHPGSEYRIGENYVEIIGGVRLKIVGWDRRYDEYENGEARLVYRDGKMILWISKRIPRPEPYKPMDVIAVDVNERKIVFGDHVINEERDTVIDRAYRWRILVESLQKKYSSPRYQAWMRRKNVLNRIRSYHRKARNILIDWARKTSLEIVRLALRLQYAVAREDLTWLIKSLRKLPKSHRTRLIIMGYARIGKWIDWQAMKHGVPLAIVDPRGSSSRCPQCDTELEENGYRRLRCPKCGLEADRDVIGKLNIRKRALKKLGITGGALTPLTAPQMTDVNPNRWGEPMNRTEGTLALQGGEEVRLLFLQAPIFYGLLFSMGWSSARFLTELVISAIVSIASLLLGVNSLVLAPLAVGYIASLFLGMDLIVFGYLFSIVAGVVLDIGYPVFLFFSAIVAHAIIGYLYIKIPRELLRISIATLIPYIAFIASFYPIALYARIASTVSGVQEWFSLGAIVAVSIVILTMGIIRRDIDIAWIVEPLISRGETIYRAIPPIARIITILASLGGSIAYRDPALLLTMLAGFAIERIVGKALNSWELKTLLSCAAPLIVYIYVILRAY